MNVVTGSLSKLDDFCSSMAKLLKSKNSTSFSPYCSIKDTACLSAASGHPCEKFYRNPERSPCKKFFNPGRILQSSILDDFFVNIIIKRYIPRVPGHKFIYFGQNLCPKNNPKRRSCLEEEVL